MRGNLMRRFTREEHTNILDLHQKNKDAARVYTELGRGEVSRELVRYWRSIFIDADGNMAKADRALAAQREFIKPQPDDDVGDVGFIPEKAQRILVIGDLHAPYQHPDALEFLCHIRDELGPDLVVNVGDETDYHALSFHDSDPNLDSAGAELEKSKVFLSQLYDEFPQMLICHSNHGSMQFRRAKAHGIPVQMLKRYRDVLLPGRENAGWSWRYAWRINTDLGPVIFKHQPSGPILGDAAHEGANLVCGHLHGNFSIDYAGSSDRLYYGMQTGCLIDKHAMAFAYGKHAKGKPVIGCCVIINGTPQLIPMPLGRDGRWIHRSK